MNRLLLLFFAILLSVPAMSQGRQSPRRSQSSPRISGSYPTRGGIHIPLGDLFKRKPKKDTTVEPQAENTSSDYQAMESLFKEAIAGGKTMNATYLIRNTAKRVVLADDMISYLRNKGYIPTGYTTQQLERSRNTIDIIDIMEFAATQDHPEYVYYNMSRGMTDYKLLKKASYYQLEREKQYKQMGFIGVFSGTKPVFHRIDNILWSGTIYNGLFHGSGKGFWKNSEGNYEYIDGTFKYGFPIKINSYRLLKGNVNGIKQSMIEDRELIVPSPEDIAENAGTYDPKLKQAIALYQGASYNGDADELEKAYQKAKTLSITNYSNFNMDTIVPRFLDDYEATGYDPKKLLPKAKAVFNAYMVVRGLKFVNRDKYYGRNTLNVLRYLSGYIDWLEDEVRADRELLEKALSIAKRGKTNDTYGFKTFFSNAIPLLESKSKSLENKISSDMAIYNSHNSKTAEENKRIEQELSKQIDDKRSKYPSGEYVEPGGIFGPTYGYYKEAGEIRFKSGNEYVTYQNYYDDDHRLHHCEIKSVSSKIGSKLKDRWFKSDVTMFEAVINAAR